MVLKGGDIRTGTIGNSDKAVNLKIDGGRLTSLGNTYSNFSTLVMSGGVFETEGTTNGDVYVNERLTMSGSSRLTAQRLLADNAGVPAVYLTNTSRLEIMSGERQSLKAKILSVQDQAMLFVDAQNNYSGPLCVTDKLETGSDICVLIPEDGTVRKDTGDE